jgi:hypothetical protein
MKPQPISKHFALILSLGLVVLVIMAASQTAMAGPGTFSVATTVANAGKLKQQEIVLIYYPPVFRTNREESEWVLVTVQPDGKARVVLFTEYYWSDAVIIYQGRLEKSYVKQLLKRVTEALSGDTSRRHYEGGPQDEQVFYLSTLPLSQTFQQRGLVYSGLLAAPRNVSDLVYELRTLWKRLEKVRPAYAYLRVDSVGRVSRQHVRQHSEFKPLETFPRELRPIVLAAIRRPLSFEPLRRPQSVRILSVIPSPTSFSVVIGGRAYRLTLYLPRTKSTTENSIYCCAPSTIAISSGVRS